MSAWFLDSELSTCLSYSAFQIYLIQVVCAIAYPLFIHSND